MKVLSNQKIIKMLSKKMLVIRKSTVVQEKPDTYARVDEARVDNAKVK